MLLRFFSLFFLLAVVGCGGGESFDRIDISGTVSVGGAPLKAGRLQLSVPPGAEGASSIAVIQDGKFQTITGQGPSPGPYDLKIVVYGEPTGEGEEGELPVVGVYSESVKIDKSKSEMNFNIEPGDLTDGG
ncbi:MAG: hypothetical protein R3C49_24905 [Planctomycetaceae bacterium]